MCDREVSGWALVVGSPGENLKGVEHDVHAVVEMLCARGFAVDVRTGPLATRDGILDGYDALIQNAQPDRPAVFYYSGHGFYAFTETGPLRLWQGICPTDASATTDDDFHGITALELSIKQSQLTKKTTNVTVILDCCYASQMSREAAAYGAVPRVLPHPVRRGFAAHLAMLRTMYPDSNALGGTGNLEAVRLVAC